MTSLTGQLMRIAQQTGNAFTFLEKCRFTDESVSKSKNAKVRQSFSSALLQRKKILQLPDLSVDKITSLL